MTWHVQYLTDTGQRRGRMVNTYPYLSTLLATPTNRSATAYQRMKNYLKARMDEVDRPIQVSSLPYHVVLDPCDVCNLSCPLCVQATDPHGRRRRTIRYEQVKSVLDDLDQSLLRMDLFNWGEPLLHPHFPALVTAARDRGIFTRTSSHLSHERTFPAEDIVASGLDYFVASIDGATQDVYERYRVGGVLATVLRNATALCEAKARRNSMTPILDWQYLVFRHNVEEVPEAERLAKELGFDVFRYGGARGVMANRVRKSSEDNFSESSDYLLSGGHALSEYTANGSKLHAAEMTGCRWLWGKLAIHADGGVSPCWTSWRRGDDFGSIDHTPLRETWRGQTFTEARRNAASLGELGEQLICKTCAHNRSFVNAPDPREEELDTETILDVAASMRDAGIEVSENVLIAVLHARSDFTSGSMCE